MKVIEVNVSAGRVVPHPFQSYANLKPQITVKAVVEDGEDWQQVTKQLQAHAEQLVEDHKDALVKNLIELEELSKRQREIASLSAGIRRAQSQLDAIRERYPQLALEAGQSDGEGESEAIIDEDRPSFGDDRRRSGW